MEILTAFTIAFGSFCFDMQDSASPPSCHLSCECADIDCRQFNLRIDHNIGQSALITRNGEHPVEVTVDGINNEKSFILNDSGQELRVWKELSGQNIKAVRFRTAKTQIYCSI